MKNINVCSKILKKDSDLSNFLLFVPRKNRVSHFHSPQWVGHMPLSQLPSETPTEVKEKEIKGIISQEQKGKGEMTAKGMTRLLEAEDWTE